MFAVSEEQHLLDLYYSKCAKARRVSSPLALIIPRDARQERFFGRGGQRQSSMKRRAPASKGAFRATFDARLLISMQPRCSIKRHAMSRPPKTRRARTKKKSCLAALRRYARCAKGAVNGLVSHSPHSPRTPHRDVFDEFRCTSLTLSFPPSV